MGIAVKSHSCVRLGPLHPTLDALIHGLHSSMAGLDFKPLAMLLSARLALSLHLLCPELKVYKSLDPLHERHLAHRIARSSAGRWPR